MHSLTDVYQRTTRRKVRALGRAVIPPTSAAVAAVVPMELA